MAKKEFGLDGKLMANCFDLRTTPMYDVWVIDFVANDRRLFKSGISRKKARRIAKKIRRQDQYSTCLVVPFGFALFSSDL